MILAASCCIVSYARALMYCCPTMGFSCFEMRFSIRDGFAFGGQANDEPMRMKKLFNFCIIKWKIGLFLRIVHVENQEIQRNCAKIKVPDKQKEC